MVEVRFQDPTHGGTTLLRVLSHLAQGAVSGRAMFAFASRQGVDLFFGCPEIVAVADADFYLVVGVSAITDRHTLIRLSELAQLHAGLHVNVFWDSTREDLYHPKICQFRYPDSNTAYIVGSGNLTPGGLQANHEAFVIVNPDVMSDATEIDDFLARHHMHLYESTDVLVLDRASQNTWVRRRIAGRVAEEMDVVAAQAPSTAEDDLLIAYAPKSRGGWAQLQLNLDVLRDFFGIPAKAGEPINLRHRRHDGTLGPIENRVVVYPENSNQNVRVELAAAYGRPYPKDALGRRPIVVFRRTGPRQFEYVTLEPGDNGHEEVRVMMDAATDSIGRGVTRIRRPLSALGRVWLDCPLP